jgi:DNA replication protein DnaC
MSAKTAKTKAEKTKVAISKMAPPSCDPARIQLLLGQLRLPAIQAGWQSLTAEADRESWPAARLLGALVELEIAERNHRRIERHLNDARLPSGKSLYDFNFTDVPTISKAQVVALAESRDWLERGGNLLFFGQPGCGKTHLAAGIGRALIEKGLRVLFVRTTDLVQRLQVARRELALEAAIAKLDKFHLLIMDDIGYVRKDQSETSVLFELICARYERRSILITANQPFGQWEKIFNEPAMTVAAIDRLVHHAIIFEMKVKRSHRWNEAVNRMNLKEPDSSDDNTVT